MFVEAEFCHVWLYGLTAASHLSEIDVDVSRTFAPLNRGTTPDPRSSWGLDGRTGPPRLVFLLLLLASASVSVSMGHGTGAHREGGPSLSPPIPNEDKRNIRCLSPICVHMLLCPSQPTNEGYAPSSHSSPIVPPARLCTPHSVNTSLCSLRDYFKQIPKHTESTHSSFALLHLLLLGLNSPFARWRLV